MNTSTIMVELSRMREASRFSLNGRMTTLLQQSIANFEEQLIKHLEIENAIVAGKVTPELSSKYRDTELKKGEAAAIDELYATLMALPKTILVDMDSVWADFYFGVLEEYERETGHKPHPHVLGTWDAKLPNGKDCYEYFRVPGFFRRLKQIHGATAFIKKARAAKHDVVICSTATLTHVPGEKYEWISEVIPDFSRSQVMFTGRKDLVRGDVLIDDHGKNTAPWLKKNPNGVAIGIAYPYNISRPEDFTHLVPSYLNFESAWEQIDKLVLG